MPRLIHRLTRSQKAFNSGPSGWQQPPFWSQSFPILSSGFGNKEFLEHDYEEYARKIYADDGVVYACIQTRALVFSEARFQWRRRDRDGRPTELFGTDALRILEQPWPGGQTGDLLTLMEVDASLAGNAYITYCDDEGNYGDAARKSSSARLCRMRPDEVEIILFSTTGNPNALNTKIAGYLYKPRHQQAADMEVMLLAKEVAHYKPMPDPRARFRGMSWLTPIIREIRSDQAASEHKKKFFENGATLNHVITLNETVGQEDFEFFLEKFRDQHEGVKNAYKTLIMGGGADVTAVGADMRQLNFAQTQGQGETRIAAASGVPPVIVGLSEGLQAATYSNYSQARRRFADGTLRPLWRMAAAALETLVDVPDGPKVEPGQRKPSSSGQERRAQLWYDDRDIPFLRDDKKEEAEIVEILSRAAKQFIESGWEDTAITEFMESRDPAALKHTGLVSVMLLPPGTQVNPAAPDATGKPTGGSTSGGGKPAAKPKPKPQKVWVTPEQAAILAAQGLVEETDGD